MRLIDADKLIEVFSEKKEVWRGNGVLPSNESLMWLAAMDITANTPTVDATPVKHGQWTEQHIDYVSDCAIDEIQALKCSVCGLYHTTPYMYNVTKYKYCPNCGAKMDLEEPQCTYTDTEP